MTKAHVIALTTDMIADLLEHPEDCDRMIERFNIKVEVSKQGAPDPHNTRKATIAANLILGHALMLDGDTRLGQQNITAGLVDVARYLLDHWCPAEMQQEFRVKFANVLLHGDTTPERVQ